MRPTVAVHPLRARGGFLWPVALLLALTLAGPAATPARAEAWRPVLLPASINQDRTVHVAEGHVQPVFLMFQASEAVRAQASVHEVDVTVNLPTGVELLDASGMFQMRGDTTREPRQERTLYRLPLRVENRYIVGSPGARPSSEWMSQVLYLAVPEQLPADQRYLEIELRAGESTSQQRWPITLHRFDQPGVQNRLSRIGLWSYNYANAGEASAPGLAAFLQQAGIGHTQKHSKALYPHLKEHGIIAGGNVHHAHFYSRQCIDISVDGTELAGGFACPVCAVEYYEPADVPGVSVMVEQARQHDGIATIDYEPGSRVGFCDRSIEKFKQEMDVSNEQFDRFRAAFVEQGVKLYVTEDSELAGLYQKWVTWRSEQVARYVAHIAEGFRTHLPEGRFELTPNAGYDDTGLATLGYGYNAAKMAPHLDAILPQIYVGYGGAEAKLAMEYVRHWRQSIAAQGAKAELHPILLVRYAGASPYNAPRRVHQQILGSIAEGADGVLLYYPDQMDAPYWIQLSETTRLLDRFEVFYHQGQRVEQQFPARNMLTGKASVGRYPAHTLVVDNPQWHYTAHELDGRVLLTLFNLHEANDILFSVQIPEGWRVTETVELEAAGKDWLVAPQTVGFVVLERQ